MSSYNSDELHADDKPLSPAELVEMIELQLSELDMLQSMFPGPGELVLSDPSLVCDLRDFAEGRRKELPPRLDFTLNLDVEKGSLSASVNLPLEYPSVYPDVFIRSQTLNRDAQHKLNQEFIKFLKTTQEGDLCLGPSVAWLQENGGSFFTCNEEVDTPASSSKIPVTKDNKFARLWIYSHHIYSKVKRKDILDLSRELDLTGFCLPGKPGIICIEGLSINTEEWWQRVRSWNWQKILIKNREVATMDLPDEDVDSHRRFSGFEELGSESDIRVKSGGYHVDMGDVFKYLDKHNSGYMFKEYFGVEGFSKVIDWKCEREE